MTKIDFLVKEAETNREDREIGAYQTRELKETSEGHERQLTKLEQPHHPS